MTQTSFPKFGNGGFNEVNWNDIWQSRDGIVHDTTGFAYDLTRINTGEIARIAPGYCAVSGWVHRVSANHDLTVSTSAGTYYIWVCYEPALNVADGSGDANPNGPCYLGISSGLPSTAGSKEYVLLWKIVRAASQALTATTVTDLRRWLGKFHESDTMPAGELATPRTLLTGFGPFCRGDRFHARATGKTYLLTMNAGGTALVWQDVNFSGWFNLPLAGGGLLVAFEAGSTPQYAMAGSLLVMRGAVKRANGNPLVTASGGSNVNIGTLPAGFRPTYISRHQVDADGNNSPAVTVAIDGVVAVKPGNAVDWVDLSAVHFVPEG